MGGLGSDRTATLVCPGCGGTRVARVEAPEIHGPRCALLVKLQVPFWTLDTLPGRVQIEPGGAMCVECGLVWFAASDLADVKRRIRRYGTAELKERILGSGDGLPLPAVASPVQGTDDLPRPSSEGAADPTTPPPISEPPASVPRSDRPRGRDGSGY